MRALGLPPADPPFPVLVPHRVVPAPRPLGDAPHLRLDETWPRAVSRRLERLSDEVVVRDPAEPDDEGLAAALRAAWGLLPPDGLRLLGVEVDLAAATARQVGDSAIPAATAAIVGRTGLDLLVVGWLLACCDDLVVLRRRGEGLLAAELLAVTFPSGWPVRRRAGASLLELHAPGADAEVLQQAAPALSEALLTKGPFVQHVWGVDPSGRLDNDPDVDYPAEPVRWHLRVERQTTLPLPHLDRALFVIRPYLTPLEALTAQQRRTLGAALASLSPAARAYKGVPDELVAQLSEGSSG